MKAILGNFKKISDSEFHLNKNLQFAQVQLDETGNVKTIQYQDKQQIEIGDILTHLDEDFEIIDINADQYSKLVVKVKLIVQEQNVPDRSKFVARKMTPRKPKTPKTIVPIPQKPNVSQEQISNLEDKIIQVVETSTINEEPEVNIDKSKKRNIFKRAASWISSKLSSYSNS